MHSENYCRLNIRDIILARNIEVWGAVLDYTYRLDDESMEIRNLESRGP